MASSIEDIEFLARSEHRVDALRTLSKGASERDELQAVTGASKATIARLLNEFDERCWVVRRGHQYELTELGQFVAEEFLRLVDRMDTERSLRDVSQWLPSETAGFAVSLFAEASITLPEVHSPYHPLPRFVELVEAAKTMHGFSKHSLKPRSYEVILRSAANGMQTELAFPSPVIDELVDVLTEAEFDGAVDSSYLDVYETDSLPMEAGFALFDDVLALYCRDSDGVTKVGIDTDDPEAIAWGQSIFEGVRSEAEAVAIGELLE
jgi:predicted transcriptional regulator